MRREAEWTREFPGPRYQLEATLNSGQAFRWVRRADAWDGVIGRRWVRLREREPGGIRAWASEPPGDWRWLEEYLGLEDEPEAICRTFPRGDRWLAEAVATHPGLHLLRQEPWECLASFILSSTKQIVQIRRIVAELCMRYGEPVTVPEGEGSVRSFPAAAVLAALPESELRACAMGFRAPYLSQTARRVAEGAVSWSELRRASLPDARRILMELPGVGRKIADCVLLFSLGFRAAFPVDVWILRVLRDLYFSGRQVKTARLMAFAENHFGPEGGYAQQFLFHWMRTRQGRVARDGELSAGSIRDGD